MLEMTVFFKIAIGSSKSMQLQIFSQNSQTGNYVHYKEHL